MIYWCSFQPRDTLEMARDRKIRYNAASVLNTGVEFLLSYKGRVSDLSYNIGAQWFYRS